MTTQSLQFQGVREWQDEFLNLFPHRFDYIFAPYPKPGQSPLWQTESRHPLSDRLIQQSSSLYGVRFGRETGYCLLDIDAASPYHPHRNPLAIARLVAALEPLGLVQWVACTSSDSGGIHLYFPFAPAIKTYQLAIALQSLLENAGFQLVLGQLEIFPNPKPYIVQAQPGLYAAHRLPLQVGSYLLNADWQPMHTTTAAFVNRWHYAVDRNLVTADGVERVVKTARRKQYGFSGKADKFLNDLNAEIEPGWTSYGQTNFLLGRIALRSYVFGHILYAAHPLEGKRLIEDIVRIAQSLPGYSRWCRHQHEIEKRAEEWARCVESSRYFHFQHRRKLSTPLSDTSTQSSTDTVVGAALSWNQQQRQEARERIRGAIADLLNQNALPATATRRFQALVQYGIGGGSLYRHRDLWHPAHLQNPVENDSLEDSLPVENASPVENSLPVENFRKSSTWAASKQESVEDASRFEARPSLLESEAGNSLLDQDFNDFEKPWSEISGNNFDHSSSQDILIGSVNFSGEERKEEIKEKDPQPKGRGDWQGQQQESEQGNSVVTAHLMATVRTAVDEASRSSDSSQLEDDCSLLNGGRWSTQRVPSSGQPRRTESPQERYRTRMQQYLESGDPILMAEAIASGVLHSADERSTSGPAATL